MMQYVSRLDLATTEGARIIKRLSNHWRHKFAVASDENATYIPFSEDSMATLTCDDVSFNATLTTTTIEAQSKLQGVIINHINRMASTQFDDAWVDVA